MEDHKVCAECGIEQPLSSYNFHPTNADKKQRSCYNCQYGRIQKAKQEKKDNGCVDNKKATFWAAGTLPKRKECLACQKSFPLTEKNFYVFYSHRDNKLQFSSLCRTCWRKYVSNKRKRTHEKKQMRKFIERAEVESAAIIELRKDVEGLGQRISGIEDKIDSMIEAIAGKGEVPPAQAPDPEPERLVDEEGLIPMGIEETRRFIQKQYGGRSG